MRPVSPIFGTPGSYQFVLDNRPGEGNTSKMGPVDIASLVPLRTSNAVKTELAPSFPLSPAAKALRVLLLQPLYPPEAVWASIKAEQGYLPPMGTISVYAWLHHRGYNVEHIDTQFGDVTEASLTAALRKGRYDVVALPVFTPLVDYACSTARLVRRVLPSCKIVFGGIHVTTLPEPTMRQCPECDFIIRHEAEYSFDELLSAYADGRDWTGIPGLVYRGEGGRLVVNPQRPFIGDLDSLPREFYADIDLKKYRPHATQYVRLPSIPILTQRGCPYSCSYCEAGLILGKKVRFFSPARIVSEIKFLIREKGIRDVYFQDSTFTINKKWTMELMELMIREKLDLTWTCNTRADRIDPELLGAMYAAGGRQLQMGIESGNQASLDLVKKGLKVEQQTQGVRWAHDAGFRCFLSYILCLPGETPEMVRNTIDYAKTLGAQTAIFFLPVPYPGSDLFESCKKDGGLRETASWSDFLTLDFDDPVYVNPLIGVEGMRYWYKRAFIEYYSTPRVLWRNLTSIRTAEDVGRLGRGVRIMGHSISHGLSGFLRYQYRGYHGQAAPLID